MKYIFIITIFIFSMNVFGNDEKFINDWKASWKTSDLGQISGSIRKSKFIGDINEETQDAMFTIVQNNQNKVRFYSFYKVKNQCAKNPNDISGVINVNGLDIEYIGQIRIQDCEAYISWYPSNDSGKSHARNAFNSGLLRFKYNEFNVVFDTSDHLPAYKLMQKKVQQLKKNSDVTQNYRLFGLDYLDKDLASVLKNLEDNYGIHTVMSTEFLKRENSATTVLFGNNTSTSFITNVSLINDEPNISFRTLSNCTPTETVYDDSIIINKQKVQSIVFCLPNNSNSDSWIIYTPKTDSGKGFTKRQFLLNQVVYLILDDVTIPIRSEGFSEVLSDVKNPGL